jgi:hypothetical protein
METGRRSRKAGEKIDHMNKFDFGGLEVRYSPTDPTGCSSLTSRSPVPAAASAARRFA